jgi:hypothetical protein
MTASLKRGTANGEGLRFKYQFLFSQHKSISVLWPALEPDFGMLELFQETVQLQEVVTLPYGSSMSHWPSGVYLAYLGRAPSQGYMAGRQDLLAMIGSVIEKKA